VGALKAATLTHVKVAPFREDASRLSATALSSRLSQSGPVDDYLKEGKVLLRHWRSVRTERRFPLSSYASAPNWRSAHGSQ
jgi:hypothetical protein